MSSRTYIKESAPSKVTCNEILTGLLGSAEQIEKWWNTPNLHFGRKTPASQEAKVVYEYLLQFV